MQDYPPMTIAQTSSIGLDITINVTGITMEGNHKYYMALFFAEIDSRVNASGQRVLDVTLNGDPFAEDLDIYAFDNQGLYNGLEVYSVTPSGPYSDNIIIEAKPKSNSSYPASIAGVEVFQLFDNPMNATTPTSSSSGMYN